MSRAKFLALLTGLFFAGTWDFVKADDNDRDETNVNHVRSFLNTAGTTLADAIKNAERESGGKAIDARIMCANEHKGSKAESVDHYVVACLVGNKITEVCVDSHNGSILDKRDTTFSEAGFRKGEFHGAPQTNINTSYTDTGSTATGNEYVAIRIQKASDLIGKNIQNPQGENLGEVQDLALDPDHDSRVAYAVVSFGGFLGMGEKWFAVPMSALTLPADAKHFVLDVPKDRLKNAMGFEKDRWPKMADVTWATDIYKFYGQRPYWQYQNTNDASPEIPLRIQKASDIMKRTVENDRGEKLGTMKDLAIDPDSGRVVYVVLSFGGFLGMGDKLFAIPPSVMQIPGTGSFTVLNVDKEQLKNARGFDKSHWPNLADPTFVNTTYEFYGQKPYRAERSKGQ